MTTARERYIQTLNFQPADPPFVRPSYGWQETMALWRQEGWDGTPLDALFDLDTLLWVAPYYGPAPEFEHQVLAEDDRTVVYVNHEGIIMREFKEHRDTSMPQFVKFPVENMADFRQLVAERLQLNPSERLTEPWREQVLAIKDQPSPRYCWADRWGGFFGPLRNLMGVENLAMAFYDQPELVEAMMEQRADIIIQTTEKVLEVTAFESFWFWEDMAYNHGSLIDPKLFRRFALKHYRRVVDWLHSRGIRHIWLDSDGQIAELIPIWLEAGVNGLWPFEVAAGMDVLQVRAQYGHDLAIAGGIDKRAVAVGGETMRAEVDRVMPLVADGGYFPELDHSAPPDIGWAKYCDYVKYLKLRLGRG
jgi:uroporphyrinogen decarboxylase